MLNYVIESLLWDVGCWASFSLKLPEKAAQRRRSFFFFFLHFRFFFVLFFLNVFAPLRTFDDFLALKRVFAVLTWILLTTGKSFVQMTHTHKYALTHTHRMLFNFFYGNFTLNAQIILYLKEPISIENTSKYNILNAKKSNKYVKSVWLGCFNLFCTIKLWNILA